MKTVYVWYSEIFQEKESISPNVSGLRLRSLCMPNPFFKILLEVLKPSVLVFPGLL